MAGCPKRDSALGAFGFIRAISALNQQFRPPIPARMQLLADTSADLYNRPDHPFA
jgi:hypothetical protein